MIVKENKRLKKNGRTTEEEKKSRREKKNSKHKASAYLLQDFRRSRRATTNITHTYSFQCYDRLVTLAVRLVHCGELTTSNSRDNVVRVQWIYITRTNSVRLCTVQQHLLEWGACTLWRLEHEARHFLWLACLVGGYVECVACRFFLFLLGSFCFQFDSMVIGCAKEFQGVLLPLLGEGRRLKKSFCIWIYFLAVFSVDLVPISNVSWFKLADYLWIIDLSHWLANYVLVWHSTQHTQGDTQPYQHNTTPH